MKIFRRQFIQRVTATGIGAAGLAEAAPRRSVTYQVTGFTCETCAVGLETLLRKEEGVVGATASYQNASVSIQWDPGKTDEPCLQQYVSSMGFRVTKTLSSDAHV